MAYIADVTPEKDRSKGMGLIGAAFGLGFILGPAIGGVFADVGMRLGDAPPFGGSFPAVIAALICLTNFISAYFFLPESRWLKSSEAPVPEKKSGRMQRIFRSLRRETLGELMILYFLNTFTLAQVEAALFLFVQDRFHWEYTRASFGFAYIGVMMAFTQGFLIRRLQPRLGEAKMMTIGLFAMGVGLFGIALSDGLFLLLALSVTALAIGNGICTPSLSGSISLFSSADEQGNNLGVAQSLSSLARILGPVCGGYLYQAAAFNAPFWLSGGVALVAAFLTLRMRARLQRRSA